MKVVRKGGEELGLVGGVEIHYIYTVYNFGPYLGLFLSILSAVGLKNNIINMHNIYESFSARVMEVTHPKLPIYSFEIYYNSKQ